ncbi:MAG: NAD-dependent epimerase/dehydratase family protein [Melioribacteraceae bacterium]|nr:NAD-dependent epimerase/dehydratase family protein [Melioribacteraceae bacterium]
MKILLIGGTGFISSKVTEFLIEKGHSVTLLVRGKTPINFNDSEKVKYIYGDRHDEALLKDLFNKEHYDVLYDMIAYELFETEIVYKAAKGKIGRFIHCSTVSVYMISDDVNTPITEDQWQSKLMPHFPRNPFGMDYGINKRKIEEFLWSKHNEKEFPVTAIRPPYVCGPKDPAKRDYFWIQRILDKKPLLVPGSGDFSGQVVFVNDLAKAFVDLLYHPNSIGQSYNVASGEINTLNEYLDKLIKMLHTDFKPSITHIPQDLFDTLSLSYSNEGDVFTFNTRRPAIFSIEKIKNDINFEFTPFEKWMSETIDWFINKHEGDSAGYSFRNDEIDFIDKWQYEYSNLIRRVKV